jgi:hypothetical protein
VITFVFLPLNWVHIICLLGNVKHTVVLQFLLLSVTTGLSPPETSLVQGLLAQGYGITLP